MDTGLLQRNVKLQTKSFLSQRFPLACDLKIFKLVKNF